MSDDANSVLILILQVNGVGLTLACVGMFALHRFWNTAETFDVTPSVVRLYSAILLGVIGFIVNAWIWLPMNVATVYWPFWWNYVGALSWAIMPLVLRYLPGFDWSFAR